VQTVEAKEAFIERTAYVGQTTGGFYWTDSKRRPTKDRQQKEAYAGQTEKGGLRWTDSRTEAFIRQTAQKGLR